MQKKINLITHQELILLYGYTVNGARGRLQTIRAALGKQTHHKLTVLDFCKAEDISLEDFDIMMKRSREKE